MYMAKRRKKTKIAGKTFVEARFDKKGKVIPYRKPKKKKTFGIF